MKDKRKPTHHRICIPTGTVGTRVRSIGEHKASGGAQIHLVGAHRIFFVTAYNPLWEQTDRYSTRFFHLLTRWLGESLRDRTSVNTRWRRMPSTMLGARPASAERVPFVLEVAQVLSWPQGIQVYGNANSTVFVVLLSTCTTSVPICARASCSDSGRFKYCRSMASNTTV